ncbi:MAG: hypothetical protein DRO14_02065 [Thermoprotei archaeon]|nr:MAG: hypothetical protein DRO14_02065 [Thermoprotei archaeon]
MYRKLILPAIFVMILMFVTNTITVTSVAEKGTIIDHDIEGNVTWTKEGSPYIITRTVAVRGILTVEPGVTILWNYNVNLYVYGKVVIKGTSEEPVVLNTTEDAYRIWSPGFIISEGEVRIENSVHALD